MLTTIDPLKIGKVSIHKTDKISIENMFLFFDLSQFHIFSFSTKSQ